MDEHVEKTANEARAGSTPHVTRVVLGISLPLAIVALLVILWIFVF